MSSLTKGGYQGRNHSQNPTSGHPTNLAGGPSVDNFTTAQKSINSGILEYLLKYGFMKTVDTFQVTYPFYNCLTYSILLG